MRVMVDTNILVSALLLPSSRMDMLINRITTKYKLVISSYVVDELIDVTRRKFTGKLNVIDELLAQLPYELVYASKQPPTGLFQIRDIKDYPILYAAIADDVDVFITGDKDFEEIAIEKPEILTLPCFLTSTNIIKQKWKIRRRSL